MKDNKESTVNTAIKKLSNYEDLEEQNKLQLLHVGDTIYFIVFGHNKETGKYEDYIQNETIISVFMTKDLLTYTTESKGFANTEIGKTVFLKQEEAEAELSNAQL